MTFRIVNFPFIYGNIPSVAVYGIFISQLLRYAKVCSNYVCLDIYYRDKILIIRLLEHGYVAT